MKQKPSIVLALLFFTVQTCSSKAKQSDQVSWLNISYVACLQNSLPCDCEKIVQGYYSIALDANETSKSFGIALSRFEQMEPYTYSIKKIAPNEYEVLNDQQVSWAKVSVKDKELQFIENSTIIRFTESRKSRRYDPYHYLEDNVDLLNEAFVSRGYPKLEKIVKENSIRCDCNKWMENKNILYVKGKPKSWIIEMNSDNLILLEITNIDRDPADPVQTKKVGSYRWN